MKKSLRDDKLVIERQTFLETCARESPSDENHRKIKEALKAGKDILTTDVRGKVISKISQKDGAWLEEQLKG